MALPVNIEELINGKTVEWERIEFRKGWNPERTIKTITAFANDFNNWSGGYIVIGIEEKNGRPVLPRKGLKLSQIDTIQKELNNLCRKITPNYFPIVEPVDFMNKKILILWCPGGSIRPYKCPSTLKKGAQQFYYIRRFSLTGKPTREEEKELISMSNQIPFDDRVNHRYSLSEFDLGAIKTFLNKINSEPEKDIPRLTIEEIARKMNIAEGSDEYLLPKNVGLLFFAKEPRDFFPTMYMQIGRFRDNKINLLFQEVVEGNLIKSLEETLSVLDRKFMISPVVFEGIHRREKWQYPLPALREILLNILVHRDYMGAHTQIAVYDDRISFWNDGGLPTGWSIKEILKKHDSRPRNPIIANACFLGGYIDAWGRGIEKIIEACRKENLPDPEFDDSDGFRVTLYANSFVIESSGASSEQVPARQPESRPESEPELEPESLAMRVLLLLQDVPLNKSQLSARLGQKQISGRLNIVIRELLKKGFIQKTIPDKPNSPKQKYVITERGRRMLKMKK